MLQKESGGDTGQFVRRGLLFHQCDRLRGLEHSIVEGVEVAEEYRRQGKPLTKWGCIRVAQYTRLRFYHQKKRWKRVFSVSLNSDIQDEDGYKIELA